MPQSSPETGKRKANDVLLPTDIDTVKHFISELCSLVQIVPVSGKMQNKLSRAESLTIFKLHLSGLMEFDSTNTY